MSLNNSVKQGGVLKVDKLNFPVLVVSKNFFNQEGLVIVCPILKESIESPLHIKISSKKMEGYVHCEDLRLLDLKARRFSVIDSIDMLSIINITDAVQGIFDYI
ncbi:MAG: type II toxin-antitoxin system PemK/MazF family toxin [Clostridiales bacterium]|nr:type II toxin-antitoxin system PemK/MazF family toxin [Candidatus Crickella equi]